MRKLLLIVLSFCFLLGMATKAEVENVKEEAETVVESAENEPNENLNVGEVKLELMGEKELNTETRIGMAIAEGKRIVKEDEGEVVFFNSKKEPVKRIKIENQRGWWIFSENGKDAGALYYPTFDYDRTEKDSFVLYDSLGNEIWSITREEDKGTIFHSRYGESPDVKIANNGSRVAALESFNATEVSADESFKVSFYGGKGENIKTITLPHPYYWQAGWSPDGEMFVVSVPGKDAYKISRDDMIYAFDKNGNKLWKYVSEGLHFIPVTRKNRQTLIISDTKVLQATGGGFILLSRGGELITVNENLMPSNFRISPNGEYTIGYSHRPIYLISLENGEILWEWKWRTKDKTPVIDDCYFSHDSKLLAVTGSSDEDKGSIFLFSIRKGFQDKIEIDNSVDMYSKSLEVSFEKSSMIRVFSNLNSKLYRVNVIGK